MDWLTARLQELLTAWDPSGIQREKRMRGALEQPQIVREEKLRQIEEERGAEFSRQWQPQAQNPQSPTYGYYGYPRNYGSVGWLSSSRQRNIAEPQEINPLAYEPPPEEIPSYEPPPERPSEKQTKPTLLYPGGKHLGEYGVRLSTGEERYGFKTEDEAINFLNQQEKKTIYYPSTQKDVGKWGFKGELAPEGTPLNWLQKSLLGALVSQPASTEEAILPLATMGGGGVSAPMVQAGHAALGAIPKIGTAIQTAANLGTFYDVSAAVSPDYISKVLGLAFKGIGKVVSVITGEEAKLVAVISKLISDGATPEQLSEALVAKGMKDEAAQKLIAKAAKAIPETPTFGAPKGVDTGLQAGLPGVGPEQPKLVRTIPSEAVAGIPGVKPAGEQLGLGEKLPEIPKPPSAKAEPAQPFGLERTVREALDNIDNLTYEEAKAYREGIRDIVEANPGDEFVQGVWKKFTKQMNDAMDIAMREEGELAKAELAAETLKSSLTDSARALWGNLTIRRYIIFGDFPEAVSVDTFKKLNSGKAPSEASIIKTGQNKGKVPSEIAFDDMMSEYGYRGGGKKNAIDQLKDDFDVLHRLYLEQGGKTGYGAVTGEKLTKGLPAPKLKAEKPPAPTVPPKLAPTGYEPIPPAVRGGAVTPPTTPYMPLPGETLPLTPPTVGRIPVKSTVPSSPTWTEYPPTGLPKQPKLGQPPPTEPPTGGISTPAPGEEPVSVLKQFVNPEGAKVEVKKPSLLERAKAAKKSVEVYMADELARMNGLGHNSEVAADMVRASDNMSWGYLDEMYRNMRTALGGNLNLGRHVYDYQFITNLLEVAKHTGRESFVIVVDGIKKKVTRQQLALLRGTLERQLGPEKFKQVQDAAQHITDTFNRVLYLADDITPEVKDFLFRDRKHYTTLIYDTDGQLVPKFSPKTIGKKVVYELSEEEVGRGLESIEKSIPKVITSRLKRINYNKALKAHAEDITSAPGTDAKIFDKRPTTGTILSYWDNGVEKFLQLGEKTKWLADEIKAYQYVTPSSIEMIGRKANMISKLGMVGWSLEFALRNVRNDMLNALFMEGITWESGKGLYRQLKAIFKEDALINLMRRAGVESAGLTSQDATKAYHKMTTGGNIILKDSKDWKSIIPRIIKAFEMAPRTAIFEKRLKQGLPVTEAAFYARSGTINFEKKGKLGRALDTLYLFFNPSIQGFLMPARAFQRNPRQFMLRAAAVSGAFAAIEAFNMENPAYDEVDDWIKNNSVFVMLPSTEYDDRGHPIPKFITLYPNLREYSVLKAPMAYVMRRLKERPSPYAGQFVTGWLPQIMPGNFSGVGSGGFAWQSLIPTQIGQTAAEIGTNYDPFRGQPIVSEELQEQVPAEQYDQYSSRMAMEIGKAFNLSPKMIDYAISNITGDVGRDVTSVVSNLINLITPIERDYRIQELAEKLSNINKTVSPDQIELARDAFLNKLSPEDRKKVLQVERAPKDNIPLISGIVRGVYRETMGGQVARTAREKAKLEGIPKEPEKEEEYTAAAVKNAKALLSDEITHEQYDKQRRYYRTFYAGRRAEEWAGARKQGVVTRAEYEKYMPPGAGLPKEKKALAEFYDIFDRKIDQYPVLDSEAWDEIEEAALSVILRNYGQSAVNYVKEHRNDWINDLPPEAQEAELRRLEMIEDESWWENYRGETKKKTLPWKPLQKAPAFTPLR